MNMRLVAVAGMIALIASGSALAAASTTPTTASPAATNTMTTTAKPKVRYYIAQATDTKACSIVTKKPDGKTATMVGKYWYSTKAKATSAMKHQAACRAK